MTTTTTVTNRRIAIAAAIGLALAAAVAGLGLVMARNADFSDRYVAEQFARQRITFLPVEHLKPAEKAQPCVVANAGQPLRTGKQAECYANSFIALHLEQYGQGKTYAEWGADEFALVARIDAARAEGASERRIAAMEDELAEIRATRDLLFKGEALRGMLLTAFGFSTLGDKAEQAAAVAYAGASALAAVSIGGLGVAAARARTRRTALAPQPAAA